MFKYTSNYGKIEYPNLTYKKIIHPYNILGDAIDETFPKLLENTLNDRWFIVHIQNAQDGFPGYCGGPPTVNYRLYMDNYGQVWKIYTEKGSTSEQLKLIIPLNTSLMPLTDGLIDIAKNTMSHWLNRVIYRGEGMHPPEIPQKNILDAFINIDMYQYKKYD